MKKYLVTGNVSFLDDFVIDAVGDAVFMIGIVGDKAGKDTVDGVDPVQAGVDFDLETANLTIRIW